MKKAILDKYKKFEFSEKLGKEIPREHWELIFSEKSNMEVSNLPASSHSRTKEDLSNSFYIDDKKYHKNKNEFYQNNPQQFKNPNYIHKKSEWRSNNYSKNVQNQNLTNENVNKNQINEFINRLEMSGVNNFSIESSNVKSDYKSRQNKPENIDYKDKKNFDSALFNSMNEKNNVSENVDESMVDPNKLILTEDIKKKLDEIPIYSVDTQTNYNFRIGQNNQKPNSFIPVDIKAIYRINEKLKYPKEDPLWYIYHVVSKSSFGPISSNQLEELYHKNNIDGMSDVRLIDIFKIKNKGSFAYFKLKDVENTHFLSESIEGSSLLKFIEELNKIKKEESEKVNPNLVEKNLEKGKKELNKEIFKQKNKPKQKFVDFEDIINEPQKKDFISIKSNEAEIKVKDNQPVENKNEYVKEIVGIKIKNEKSVIDEELIDVKDNTYEIKQNHITTHIKKKPGKKMKGKPVELDIKTGFYTLSQQEKEYEPIYICGDSSNKK